jgi:hypothetical protein
MKKKTRLPVEEKEKGFLLPLIYVDIILFENKLYLNLNPMFFSEFLSCYGPNRRLYSQCGQKFLTVHRCVSILM